MVSPNKNPNSLDTENNCFKSSRQTNQLETLLSGLIAQAVLAAKQQGVGSDSRNHPTPGKFSFSRIDLLLRLLADNSTNPALYTFNALKMCDPLVAENIKQLVSAWMSGQENSSKIRPELNQKIIELIKGCLPNGVHFSNHTISDAFDTIANNIINLVSEIDNPSQQDNPSPEAPHNNTRNQNKLSLDELFANSPAHDVRSQLKCQVTEFIVKLAGIATASSICFTQPVGLIGCMGVTIIQGLVNFFAHEHTNKNIDTIISKQKQEQLLSTILCHEINDLTSITVQNRLQANNDLTSKLEQKARQLNARVESAPSSLLINDLFDKWSLLYNRLVKPSSSSQISRESILDVDTDVDTDVNTDVNTDVISMRELSLESKRLLLERCLSASSVEELNKARARWANGMLSQICICGVSNVFGVLANGFGAIAEETLLQGMKFIPVQAGQVLDTFGRATSGITQVMKLDGYVQAVATDTFARATGMPPILSEKIAQVFSQTVSWFGESFFGSMDNFLTFCDSQWRQSSVEAVGNMFRDNPALQELASSGVREFNLSNVWSSCARLGAQVSGVAAVLIQLLPILNTDLGFSNHSSSTTNSIQRRSRFTGKILQTSPT